MTFFSLSRSSSFSTLSTLTIALGSALVAVAAMACSSTTASTPTGTSGGTSGTTSGGTPVSADACASRCSTVLTKCGDTMAKDDCTATICNNTPSDSQLTCFEGKSCAEIMGATGFAALCPGSTSTSGGTSGATSGGTSGTPAAAMCGKATCTSGQYCSLNYDSSAMSWSDGSCKAVPSACTSKGPADLCDCMKMNAGCPTSGLVTTKCNQDNGALSFGCN